MTIRAACPQCRHVYQLADELRGKKVRCKSCQQSFVVNALADAKPKIEPPADVAASQPRRRKKRPARPASGFSASRIAVLVVSGLVVVGGAFGLIWWLRGPSSAKTLSQLTAQLNRNEPGWRMEGLEAQRESIPAEKNSAPVILAARRQFDKQWISSDLQESIKSREPSVKMDAATAAGLKEALDRVQPALAEARKVADMPRGRFSITHAPNVSSTQMPHLQPTREVAILLAMDAILRALQGDGQAALASCRAAVNVGRSLYDEPMSLSQIVRLACQSNMIIALENVLAQSQPPDDALAALQELLEDEAGQPIFLIMARCERAYVDALMTSIRNGEIKPADVSKMLGETREVDPSLFTDMAAIDQAHFWLLGKANRLVEIARLPAHEQQSQLDTLEKATQDAPPLAKLLQVSGLKFGAACQRGTARLSCAATAIAAERYRRVNGRWPDTLNALVPGQLTKVPLDPYDGKPLRMVRRGDGLVIYAVGPDLQDNGGTFDNDNPNRAGADVGFRLGAGGR